MQAPDRDAASRRALGDRPRAARRALRAARLEQGRALGRALGHVRQPGREAATTPSRSRRPGGSTPTRPRASAWPAEPGYGRLYPPPPAPDDPDDLRDHGDQLRRRAVRAGRPGRADHRAAAGHRRRRDGAHLAARRAATSAAGGDERRGGDASLNSKYRGAQGLPPEFIAELEKQFGFDKPPLERFGLMLWNYIRFDFGESYFRDTPVLSLIVEKLPVSISLGLWMTLLSYLISIPLGIRKAVRDGSRFDVWTSGVIIVAYAIPGFLFAILLIVLFAGGSFFDCFPLRGLTSDNWAAALLAGAHPRLFLAPRAAAHRDGARRLRDDDAAHQELVPRRDPQAVRDDGARQGPDRAAGALRPRLPQRDADRHRRLPGRLHLRLLRRLAADRDDLLARWARAARLRERHGPRLSGGLRARSTSSR